MLNLAMFALSSALAATPNSFAAPVTPTAVPTAAASPVAMTPAINTMRSNASSNAKKQPQANATPWPGYLTPGQEAEINERLFEATFSIDRSP